MVEPLRHRQTKEAATDMFSLQPPRHIPTLPIAAQGVSPRHVRTRREPTPPPKPSVGRPAETCSEFTLHGVVLHKRAPARPGPLGGGKPRRDPIRGRRPAARFLIPPARHAALK